MIVWITASGLIVVPAQASAVVPVTPPPAPPPPVVYAAPPAPPPPVVYAPPPAPPPRPLDPHMPRPLTSPGSWVTDNDYPIVAMRAGQSGTVGFRLLLDATGKPTSCIVTRSSGATVLDDATCTLLMDRARFSPALDARMKPTVGAYSNSVRWNIPDDLPMPVLQGAPGTALGRPYLATARMHQPRPIGDTSQWITVEDYPAVAARAHAEGTVGYRLDIEADGKVSGCEVLASSNSPLIDTATCRLIKQRGFFEPATDLQGKPTRGAYWGSMRWTLPEDPDHPKPLHFRVSFTVDESGEVHDCLFETPSGEGVRLAEILGKGCAGWMRYKPFTDAAGKLVKRRVTIAQDVTTDDPVEDAKAPKSDGPVLRTVPDYPGVRGS